MTAAMRRNRREHMPPGMPGPGSQVNASATNGVEADSKWAGSGPVYLCSLWLIQFELRRRAQSCLRPVRTIRAAPLPQRRFRQAIVAVVRRGFQASDSAEQIIDVDVFHFGNLY